MHTLSSNTAHLPWAWCLSVKSHVDGARHGGRWLTRHGCRNSQVELPGVGGCIKQAVKEESNLVFTSLNCEQSPFYTCFPEETLYTMPVILPRVYNFTFFGGASIDVAAHVIPYSLIYLFIESPVRR
jgi:hypothetical protein